MKEFWDAFGKLPWHKVAAPILPVLMLDVYLGTYLMNLYKFNVSNDLLDKIPTNATFNAFLISNIFMIFIFLAINTFHNYSDGKIKYLKSISKLKVNSTEIK